jgi:hypothetical protein
MLVPDRDYKSNGTKISPEINYPFGTLRERAESLNPLKRVKRPI